MPAWCIGTPPPRIRAAAISRLVDGCESHTQGPNSGILFSRAGGGTSFVCGGLAHSRTGTAHGRAGGCKGDHKHPGVHTLTHPQGTPRGIAPSYTREVFSKRPRPQNQFSPSREKNGGQRIRRNRRGKYFLHQGAGGGTSKRKVAASPAAPRPLSPRRFFSGIPPHSRTGRAGRGTNAGKVEISARAPAELGWPSPAAPNRL